ncbi:glycine betaine/L-proline ABC transporter permease ProW [Oceanobacter sp. 5_MG-2023]|uniref:glycine betaine/L-proline ABC transporter permease ProW n=1 Tax=Oceanobacter sp. 5_MG-2023 TaxID=3062645 RepID=UPI0026E48702|nr:glycine betaine/L-proline ABC transporter permease ProW [Oceanobacter sp. 5_MG-2023]MDO6681093.1 glycine betaine/L-proline ABC transporter permease ProW [Oceanobacter sp. 5_MG-2023]
MSNDTNPFATEPETSQNDELQDNPFATAEPAAAETGGDNPFATENMAETNPWGNAEQSEDNFQAEGWLQDDRVQETVEATLSNPFPEAWVPLQDWVEYGLDWMVVNFRPFFTAVKVPVDATLNSIDVLLNSTPPLLMIALFALLAWQLAGGRLAIGTALGMFVLGAIGAWSEAMTTLSLVLTSVFFCILLGLPLGVLMARNDRLNRILRPTLDAMQTTPAFVYLVPIVMLFGIGNVPGVVVTIVFAMPPVIRLTNLGIRQVPGDLIEASESFGASPSQMLFKVQLPLAMPTIMAGVNQTLMLSLSMVVIASMISVGGLGLMVLRGIGRLDIGLAAVGGIGIVILAIILDRLTQALGQDARARGVRHWYQTGPVGLLLRLTSKNP